MLDLIATTFISTAKLTDTPELVASGTCFQATYYEEGSITASGEPFYADGLTAASLSYPFGTWLRVTNQNNGRSVIVRITDRGPWGGGAQLDLSRGAFRQIASLDEGIVPVCVSVE